MDFLGSTCHHNVQTEQTLHLMCIQTIITNKLMTFFVVDAMFLGSGACSFPLSKHDLQVFNFGPS